MVQVLLEEGSAQLLQALDNLDKETSPVSQPLAHCGTAGAPAHEGQEMLTASATVLLPQQQRIAIVIDVIHHAVCCPRGALALIKFDGHPCKTSNAEAH